MRNKNYLTLASFGFLSVEDDMLEEKYLILPSLLPLSVFYVKKMVAGGIVGVLSRVRESNGHLLTWKKMINTS